MPEHCLVLHYINVTQLLSYKASDRAGLETYFFSNSQTFASGFNLNSQIAVSNSQLDFPLLDSF